MRIDNCFASTVYPYFQMAVTLETHPLQKNLPANKTQMSLKIMDTLHCDVKG